MTPILEEMEVKLKEELQTDIEIPSYVNDILVCLLDKSGTANINQLLHQSNWVVNAVAIKHNLRLQPDKHEEIVFNPEGK